jgi:hypothetical protein
LRVGVALHIKTLEQDFLVSGLRETPLNVPMLLGDNPLQSKRKNCFEICITFYFYLN